MYFAFAFLVLPEVASLAPSQGLMVRASWAGRASRSALSMLGLQVMSYSEFHSAYSCGLFLPLDQGHGPCPGSSTV